MDSCVQVGKSRRHCPLPLPSKQPLTENGQPAHQREMDDSNEDPVKKGTRRLFEEQIRPIFGQHYGDPKFGAEPTAGFVGSMN